MTEIWCTETDSTFSDDPYSHSLLRKTELERLQINKNHKNSPLSQMRNDSKWGQKNSFRVMSSVQCILPANVKATVWCAVKETRFAPDCIWLAIGHRGLDLDMVVKIQFVGIMSKTFRTKHRRPTDCPLWSTATLPLKASLNTWQVMSLVAVTTWWCGHSPLPVSGFLGKTLVTLRKLTQLLSGMGWKGALAAFVLIRQIKMLVWNLREHSITLKGYWNPRWKESHGENIWIWFNKCVGVKATAVPPCFWFCLALVFPCVCHCLYLCLVQWFQFSFVLSCPALSCLVLCI